MSDVIVPPAPPAVPEAATPAAVPLVTPPWLDKGLWVAVLTPVLLAVSQQFGFTMDPVSLVSLVLPAVAYIIGHKWKTGTIAAAMVSK